VRAPTTVGANVTLMMQVFDPAVAGKVAGLIGQAVAPVLVSAKSPDAAIEVIVNGPNPVLVRVTVFAALVVVSICPPKSRLVGANPTPGAVAEPVPFRLTSNAWELDSPPFVIVTVITIVAVSAAETEGVKVTLTVHEAPAAMLPPHVLDGEAKSALLVPLKVTAVPGKGIASEVLFVSETVFAALVTAIG